MGILINERKIVQQTNKIKQKTTKRKKQKPNGEQVEWTTEHKPKPIVFCCTLLQMETKAQTSPAVDSIFWQQLSLRQPVPQMSLERKFLVMTNQVYYNMNFLLNRHKENRHKTLTDFLLHRINERNTTSRFIRQCTIIKVPVLQLAKK